MKTHLNVFVIFFLFITSFTVKHEDGPLTFVNQFNTLKLVYKNNKCGEWGGDREIITIYRKNDRGRLFANYSKEIKDCDKIDSERFKKKETGSISVSTANENLILESIQELTAKKLSREDIPSHTGLYCEVLLKDSSIVIRDFPAGRWIAFERLVEELNTVSTLR